MLWLTLIAERGKGACIHLSSAKSSDSTTIIYKMLESLGFTVNKESSIASAGKKTNS